MILINILHIDNWIFGERLLKVAIYWFLRSTDVHYKNFHYNILFSEMFKFFDS